MLQNRKIAISLQRFDGFRRNLTRWCVSASRNPSVSKILAIVKLEKIETNYDTNIVGPISTEYGVMALLQVTLLCIILTYLGDVMWVISPLYDFFSVFDLWLLTLWIYYCFFLNIYFGIVGVTV